MTEKILISGFGARIAEAAKNRGLSLAQLAEKANITRSRIYTYINEESIPSAEALARISSILELSTDFILFGKTVFSEKNISDSELKLAFDTIEKLYNSDDPNLRGWAIITFEKVFEDYIDKKNQQKDLSKAQ